MIAVLIVAGSSVVYTLISGGAYASISRLDVDEDLGIGLACAWPFALVGTLLWVPFAAERALMTMLQRRVAARRLPKARVLKITHAEIVALNPCWLHDGRGD